MTDLSMLGETGIDVIDSRSIEHYTTSRFENSLKLPTFSSILCRPLQPLSSWSTTTLWLLLF
jgi:hypothetical protein